MAFTTFRTWTAGEIVTASLVNEQLKANGEILKTSINNSGALSFVDATELTVASGVITVTGNYHKVDTQSDASSDDVDTITAGTNVVAGHILALRCESDARTIVLKDGTSGSDNLDLGADITLDESHKTFTLILDTDGNWRPLTLDRSTTAAGSDTHVQFNDGGTDFGGDAGLVYNKSTDVLTAGKLATTDTSATSIDVAGGVTAGTGNVAIVNAAGKIPEISSTYFDSLSGANLTGISAGKILQVVTAYYTAQVGSTSSTMATTNVTSSITLADANNKCLVIATIGGVSKSGATGVTIRLQRAISGGATSTVTGGSFEHSMAYTASTATNYAGGSSITALDNPTTTSALTYTIEFSNASNASNAYVMVGNGRGTITLMEVEV